MAAGDSNQWALSSPSRYSILEQVIGSDLLAKHEHGLPDFEVLRDNPFADQVIDIIELQEYTCFTIRNTDDDYPLSDCDMVSVTIMTTLIDLHESLFAFPPNLTQIMKDDDDGDDGDEISVKYQDHCCFEVSRVGKVTGDLCMTITGEVSNVVQVSYQEYSNPYCTGLHILTSF
ncbi:hypothetical protein BN7_1380 [Wickerhamomyces ciferrii]|uniref:Uncharacterized protein n=1 Tax=Wickerhamomyces ciferrii (strain ATCC 14091 / BCRC 22168 / CBS 111 / JCM 3599 / NBRC 0793 / NRRL Y-1031 F-60-10) TaxID=1206466 RepID=K0KFZ3_WICCF|nr:uncharacterized protein BN7_1380 [Wickerhamomyces ciferrii]CCH41841.1 hypothetical protein BN7_1380 [Wickerhamomyces ciferrii]